MFTAPAIFMLTPETLLLRPGVNADQPPYLDLAMALRSVGEERLYEEAMQRMRFAIDIFRAGGDVFWERELDEARYCSIAGEKEWAQSLLEAASAKKSPLDIYEFIGRAYQPLWQEPRYMALREKSLVSTYEERAILGYETLTLVFAGVTAILGE